MVPLMVLKVVKCYKTGHWLGNQGERRMLVAGMVRTAFSEEVMFKSGMRRRGQPRNSLPGPGNSKHKGFEQGKSLVYLRTEKGHVAGAESEPGRGGRGRREHGATRKCPSLLSMKT